MEGFLRTQDHHHLKSWLNPNTLSGGLEPSLVLPMKSLKEDCYKLIGYCFQQTFLMCYMT